MFKQTALTSIDSYKLGHADQYPAGTTKVYSNFTPRSDSHFATTGYANGTIVWFGIQGFLHELKTVWDETFFNVPKSEVVEEFKRLAGPFCGPNGFNTARLEALHDLGYLPLKIKALPEGSSVNIGVPVLTITNTRAEEYWLPNFLETWMSSELWKSSTSATISRAYRKIIDKFAEITGGNKEFISWQGHDFSVRGMSGIQDAAKSGAGHLLSFTGTDNIPAVKYIEDVYRGKETFIGGSVPATEHSVMCAGGKESEIETFRRLLKTYPSGVVSIVSDTWDFWNVITNMASELKEEILSRTPDSLGLAKVVFRPDSGDPVKILTGYMVVKVPSIRDQDAMINAEADGAEAVYDESTGKYYTFKARAAGWTIEFDFTEIPECVVKGAVECLWDIFGGTTNDKGYRTLNQRVGLIYGDSITLNRASKILGRLAMNNFASDNVVFGIGSYTFQYNTRDTFGFAMKATYVETAEGGRAIFKDPKTDSGTKKSAKGLLKVSNVNGAFVLKNDVTASEEDEGCLRTVFLNGDILVNESFADIRSRLNTI